MMKLLSLTECEALSLKEVRRLYKDYVNPGLENIIYSFSAGEELIDHAEGVWLYTKNGRKILDISGGIGVLNLGHNHPRILEARIRYQQQKRMEVHKTLFSPHMAALSHNLAQLLPGDLDYPFFCNSGAEAVEGAIKLAYKFHEGRRKQILHADVSFHGKLLGSGGLTNIKESGFRFPTIPGIRDYEYHSFDSLHSLVTELRQSNGDSDVYAIILEPFNAITVRYVSEQYLKDLRALCDAENILLIIDEVFCGWCKTGPLFRFMQADIVPDVLTMSKSLGGGKSSISAYVTRRLILKKAYGDVANATLHSSTYNGFGEECATALEAVNILIEDDYVGKSREIERLVKQRASALLERFPEQIEEIRGQGALHGIFFRYQEGVLRRLVKMLPVQMLKDDNFIKKLVVASVVDRLFSKHDIFTYFNNNQDVGVMVAPSLVIEKEQIDYFFDAMEDILKKGVYDAAGAFIKNKLLKSFT